MDQFKQAGLEDVVFVPATCSFGGHRFREIKVPVQGWLSVSLNSCYQISEFNPSGCCLECPDDLSNRLTNCWRHCLEYQVCLRIDRSYDCSSIISKVSAGYAFYHLKISLLSL